MIVYRINMVINVKDNLYFMKSVHTERIEKSKDAKGDNKCKP